MSRPPWFTALALWWVGGTYCAGGFFPGRRSLWLGGNTGPPDRGRLPPWLTLDPDAPPHLDRTNNWTERTVYHNRLLRAGWKPVLGGPSGVQETWERPHPDRPLTLVMTELHTGFAVPTFGGPYLTEYAIRTRPDGALTPLGQATWADWDHRSRLILARGGRLMACELDGSALQEIADFNGQAPGPAAAPAAARNWPRAPRSRQAGRPRQSDATICAGCWARGLRAVD